MNFNINSIFNQCILATYKTDINTNTGSATFAVQILNPLNELKFPEEASHFKIISRLCQINFTDHQKELQSLETDYLEINNKPVDIEQAFTFDTSLNVPIFLITSIQYYQSVNNEMKIVKDGLCTPMAILDLDKGK